MALKSDDVSEKNSLFLKRKFNILIGLLIAIIILLCILIIVLTTSNILSNSNYDQINNERDVNSTDKHSNNDGNQTQLLKSSNKLIYRSSWGGHTPLYERPQKVPVKYVIISHTAGASCFSLTDCSKQMTMIQTLHVEAGSPDIGYNFLIGGDANIYVGRGWDNHNFHMNLDTIGICFIGNYIYNNLSSDMIRTTQELLKQGVELGKLTKDYIIVAHNQTYQTQSPGPNVYKQIKFWPHFSPELLNDIDSIQ